MDEAQRILRGLNEQQREAVLAVTGPVVIVAGAGTGKTRVVSHRAAYAVASGTIDEQKMLLVTFTRKAATEMAERVRTLGLSHVAARTFSSAALAQLRYFWPTHHPNRALPEVMSDKWRPVARLAQGLPGGYRFTPLKDLIDELEWAKARRIGPDDYTSAIDGLGQQARREPPIPVGLFVGLFHGYEREKAQRGVIDFEDILSMTVDLLESDDHIAQQVRKRYSWLSVDEFQDTTPLQYRLLELWIGDRRDICVVGDEDQTIYTFAGASPQHLRRFASRYPGARVIALVQNYRSSPQILGLANDLLVSEGRSKRLVACREEGPNPSLLMLPDDQAEIHHLVRRIRELISGGVPPDEIAILVRLNAQIEPFESALTQAGIPSQVRGQRFYERQEVKAAVGLLRRLPRELRGTLLVEAAEASWRADLGFTPDGHARGREAQERQAALTTLLAIVRDEATVSDSPEPTALAGGDGARSRDEVVAAILRRSSTETAGVGQGVELLTLHAAKGLEWEAVFLPSLEEGILPVARAAADVAALEEERRLVYVGITRARTHLSLTWAARRVAANGRVQTRKVSRFVAPLLSARSPTRPPTAPVRRSHGFRPAQDAGSSAGGEGLVGALKQWRLERSRADSVPAYVVLHDKTILAVAERCPTSAGELLGIPGIGQAKLARYGDDILRVIVEQG